MRLKTWSGLALAATLVGGAAYAVKPGGTLYIKSKDAKVLDKADFKAKAVSTLQPGAEVTWEGAAEGNKMFHKVKAGGVEGFTLQQNLTPNKPQMEALLKDDGKPIDTKAFASSGAATKALSEAALKYAEKKQTPQQVTKGILTAEGVAVTVSKEQAQAFVQRQTGGGK